MQSGISASEALHAAFTTLLSTPTQRGLLASIAHESIIPLSALPLTSTFHADLTQLAPHLTPTTALYIILRLDEPTGGFVLISYVPDAAPVRQKLLLASSQLALARELGPEHFVEKLFVTAPEELTPEGWRKHEAHVLLQAPLTAEEEALQGVKAAEEVGRGTGARASHVSSGLGCPLSAEALTALRELVSGTVHSLVQLKVDTAAETIELASVHAASENQAVTSLISASEPRYSFFYYHPKQHAAGEAVPIVFLYTCPTASKIKERMIYASALNGVVVSAQQEAGVKIAKRMEASSPEEVTAQSLEEEFAPREEVREAFARPKRPGKK
ncbi:MAG: Twinfilin-1 [Trizodia sp. TS-e1964]|nr:MAG: Twinfilin-1 [Trizodia sp. TS-e1964]